MLFLRHDLFLFNQHATGTLCYGIKAHEHLQTDTEFVKKKISKGCTPEVNNQYQEKHEKTWYYIHQAGKASLKLDPFERPSTKILQDILSSTLEYVSYPLCNHQGTALVQAQEINIGKNFVF